MEFLNEYTEVAWLEYLNRFEQVINPTIFKNRNISLEAALKLWSDDSLRSKIEELINLLKEKV